MKKIIIIGANNFQLPLILRAREMGYETHVFAWKEGAVGKESADYFYPISIIEKEIILDAAKKIDPQGIVTAGSDLASITVNYVAGKLGLAGNSMDCTRLTTNKYLMREKLKENSLGCPKFTRMKEAGDVHEFFDRYPLIVKPTDRSGSRGVMRVDSLRELEKALDYARNESFTQEVITEEYIEGHEYSVEMISWKGVHEFLQITEKETTGPPYFVEKAHHQPAALTEELRARIIDLVKNALTCLGVYYGASHSEVMVTDNNELYIIEIGARMGGDHIGAKLVELSTGYDYLGAVIETAAGIKPAATKKFSKWSGIYFIIPGAGRVIEVTDNAYAFPEVIETGILVRKGDNVIFPVTESQHRSAYFIYQSDTRIHFDDPLKVIEIKTSSI